MGHVVRGRVCARFSQFLTTPTVVPDPYSEEEPRTTPHESGLMKADSCRGLDPHTVVVVIFVALEFLSMPYRVDSRS